MATATATILPTTFRATTRTAVIASADGNFRKRLSAILGGLRWRVREASGGAQAWGEALDHLPQTMIVDSWLPDLDVAEFLTEFRKAFPHVDVITAGSVSPDESTPGPHRQEVFYALRRIQDADTAAWNTAPRLDDGGLCNSPELKSSSSQPAGNDANANRRNNSSEPAGSQKQREISANPLKTDCGARLPELIGNCPCMLEISKRIRLVAPRSTPVLIEGPTGSGKELVAEALHRLSLRNRKPFVAINCAAIPESLLEAELFGHTRGAFTGAVQSRVGRIESADGGTLFLDEIGEMPLGLQSKLLRFVESGELQRVGDNETVKVDVRIIAATHEPLAQNAQSGNFRSDLYYRLAVFLIRTPALADHLEDVPILVDHFLECMGRETPVKRIDESALKKLSLHEWPGNVRELEHVLERAAILAGDKPTLEAADIEFGIAVN